MTFQAPHTSARNIRYSFLAVTGLTAGATAGLLGTLLLAVAAL